MVFQSFVFRIFHLDPSFFVTASLLVVQMINMLCLACWYKRPWERERETWTAWHLLWYLCQQKRTLGLNCSGIHQTPRDSWMKSLSFMSTLKGTKQRDLVNLSTIICDKYGCIRKNSKNTIILQLCWLNSWGPHLWHNRLCTSKMGPYYIKKLHLEIATFSYLSLKLVTTDNNVVKQCTLWPIRAIKQ